MPRAPRPRVTWVFGSTLDGRVAAPDGTSRWISSRPARVDAHRLRAAHDAVLVGSGAARIDDPHLALRHGDPRQAAHPDRARRTRRDRDRRVAGRRRGCPDPRRDRLECRRIPGCRRTCASSASPSTRTGGWGYPRSWMSSGASASRRCSSRAAPRSPAPSSRPGSSTMSSATSGRRSSARAGRCSTCLGVTTIGDLHPFRLVAADVIGEDVRMRMTARGRRRPAARVGRPQPRRSRPRSDLGPDTARDAPGERGCQRVVLAGPVVDLRGDADEELRRARPVVHGGADRERDRPAPRSGPPRAAPPAAAPRRHASRRSRGAGPPPWTPSIVSGAGAGTPSAAHRASRPRRASAAVRRHQARPAVVVETADVADRGGQRQVWRGVDGAGPVELGPEPRPAGPIVVRAVRHDEWMDPVPQVGPHVEQARALRRAQPLVAVARPVRRPERARGRRRPCRGRGRRRRACRRHAGRARGRSRSTGRTSAVGEVTWLTRANRDRSVTA